MEEIKFNPDDEEEDEETEEDTSDVQQEDIELKSSKSRKFWDDIAEAILLSVKSNDEKKDDFDPLARQDKSQSIDETDKLTPDEETIVNQTIAQEHLETPITVTEPEEPVVEFLEEVVDGTEPSVAFEEVIEQNQLDEPVDNEEPLANQADDNQANLVSNQNVNDDNSDQSQNSSNQGPIGAGVAAAGAAYLLGSKLNKNNGPHVNNPTNKQANIINARNINKSIPLKKHAANTLRTKLAGDALVAGTILSAGITLSIIAKRRQEKKTELKQDNNQERRQAYSQELKQPHSQELKQPKKTELKQDVFAQTKVEQLNKQVVDLQKNLSIKELTIQDLALAKKDKLKDSLVNNKADLSVESIGSVVVGAIEKSSDKAISSTEQLYMLKNIYKPEQIANLKREDLVAISSKIEIEGASLKNIYENGLISEKSLRQIVANYLRGKDIRRQLRKEILDNANDFEVDPISRHKTTTASTATNKTVDDNVKTEKQTKANSESDKAKASQANNEAPNNEPVTTTAPHYITTVIAVIVAVAIIGIFIYILYNR